MKLPPGQLSLFELDASGQLVSRPAELPGQRQALERDEALRVTPAAAPEGAPRATSPPSRSLLSPEDVARRFGLSRKAVYRAVARGELRAARIRSRLRIDPGDLEAWFQASLVDPIDRPPTAPVPGRLPVSTGLRRLLPGT